MCNNPLLSLFSLMEAPRVLFLEDDSAKVEVADAPCPLHADNEGDFRRIYEAHFRVMLNVSYGITGDREASEDIAEVAFIKAHEKAMVFSTLDDAKYWLLRVTRNASLTYVTRKKSEERSYKRAFYEDARETKTSEKELLEAEDVKLVRKALNSLPEKFREVLVLKEYGNLSYKEIAATLNISESLVKVRIFRARSKLLEALEKANFVR